MDEDLKMIDERQIDGHDSAASSAPAARNAWCRTLASPARLAPHKVCDFPDVVLGENSPSRKGFPPSRQGIHHLARGFRDRL
eukprot:731233-Prorocentrum_minimum.AAC.2